MTSLALALGLLVLSPFKAPAQPPETPAPNPVREKYTKHEFKIRVRDGLVLFTSIYVPKDASRTYAIMMQRTPYSVGPYGIDNSRGSQSSWFPLVDRNPQKFMDIGKAVEADFVKATHQIRRGSSATLNVVP